MFSSTSSASLPFRAVLVAGCIAGCGGKKQASQTNPEPATVTSEDIARSPGEPVEEQLMARFPGVTVLRTSGGTVVRIRGATSLNGTNEPLYIIDGIRVRPGLDGALAGLDPHDIAMIQVLKDAVSMVTYGGDAANGVIIIKTKRAPPR
ncbi:MAG TPA: TonB-dependent receptor plug domain-containing protein [Gemmatimonadales bacterium]|jgi:TonB-dependent SusC/RagA subfamily outer membrane receptor|nr:TonB-dependent receptor plug domain-containing protein [Gemmatimonadales bacterium]